MFKVPEKFRIKYGLKKTSSADGNNGAFHIHSLKLSRSLYAIASDGEGWEHVSVSLHNRCPTWEEMNFVKNLFWDEDDVVIQYHPAKQDYVNNHPYCLHMWRPIGVDLPVPDSLLVGVKLDG